MRARPGRLPKTMKRAKSIVPRCVRLSVLAMGVCTFIALRGQNISAQNIDQYNASVFQKRAPLLDAVKEDPAILFSAPGEFSDPANLSVSSIRAALQGFLRDFPRVLGTAAKREHAGETRAILETISNFMDSPRFDREVQKAQQSGAPIELFFFSVDPLKQANMYRDFSKHFEFPLRFESADQVSPASVSLSLSNSAHALLIQWESPAEKSIYVVNPETGFVSHRYIFSHPSED